MQWDRYSRKRGSFPHRHPCLLRSQLPLHLPSVLFYSASKPTGNWPETIRIWWFRKATPQSLIYPGILIRLIPSTGFLFRTTRSMILWNPLPRNLLILSGQKSKCPLSWSSTISGKRIIWNLFSCSLPSGKEFHIAKEDSSLTQLANTSVYKMLSAPSPTLSLYTLNQDGNLYFVRSIYNLTSGNVMGTMIVAVNEEKWSNSLTRNLTDGWRIFLFNDAFTLLSGSPDVTEPEIDALKSSWQIRIGRNWRQSLLLLKIILPWPIRSIFWISQRRLWHQKHSCVLRYTMSWALIFWSFSWFCWSVCSIPL